MSAFSINILSSFIDVFTLFITSHILYGRTLFTRSAAVAWEFPGTRVNLTPEWTDTWRHQTAVFVAGTDGPTTVTCPRCAPSDVISNYWRLSVKPSRGNPVHCRQFNQTNIGQLFYVATVMLVWEFVIL